MVRPDHRKQCQPYDQYEETNHSWDPEKNKPRRALSQIMPFGMANGDFGEHLDIPERFLTITKL